MHRPRHVRAVALFAVLITLAAAVEYVLCQYRVDAFMSRIPPEYVRYLKGLPDGVEFAWGIAVWFGLLGALLLLGNRRNAPALLAVAAIAAVGLALWLMWGEPVPLPAALGTWATACVAGWAALLAVFWLYARAMHARGVIR